MKNGSADAQSISIVFDSKQNPASISMRNGKDHGEDRMLYLDPLKIREKKDARRYHLNVFQIPLLRLFGFGIISLLVLFHNVLILQSFNLSRFFLFVTIIFSYGLVSWLILYAFYSKFKAIDLGIFFLGVDIIVFALAIYFSGGDKSWLFILMVVRVADQTYTNFKRVIIFTHLSIIIYFLLLVYLFFIEQRPISWMVEFAKLFLIYCVNIYISITAKTAEKLRNQTNMSIQIARKELKAREETEEKLRQEKELLRSTLESSSDGILVVDNGGTVTHVNDRFAQMWRIPLELIDTKDDEKLLNSILNQLDDPDAFLEKVKSLYASKKNDFDTIFFKDGRVFERISYALVKNGKIAGRAWNFRDITERKQAESQLKETLSKLKKYNELMMGREERMLELKAEVNILMTNSGLEAKYKTAAHT